MPFHRPVFDFRHLSLIGDNHFMICDAIRDFKF